MITQQTSQQDIRAWLNGRLPSEWTQEAPQITVDDEEILVEVTIPAPDLEEGADESAQSQAVAGRISGWREDTRDTRMAIAREAQQRFGRTVSWGARVDDRGATFTSLAVPVMTRLRQPERIVLDTLVEAGVARSRSDALRWCVRLVGRHSEEWLDELRSAMEQVRTVRDRAPA